MGWEKRGNRLYYYRKKREGRRVKSEYVGTGFAAFLTCQVDLAEREDIRLARTNWRKQQSELAKIDADAARLVTTVQSIVCAALVTSGYHPHKGQWRKARNVK